MHVQQKEYGVAGVDAFSRWLVSRYVIQFGGHDDAGRSSSSYKPGRLLSSQDADLKGPRNNSDDQDLRTHGGDAAS